MTRFQMMSDEALSWLRTYQLLHYLVYPPRVSHGNLDFSQLIRLTRVPPEYFVDNVESMIDLSHRAGIPILFVESLDGASATSPANGALFPPELVIRIHTLYRELLRRAVSRHPGAAVLVDVSPPEFDESLIGGDGIHPSAAGYARIAGAVSEALGPLLGQRHS